MGSRVRECGKSRLRPSGRAKLDRAIHRTGIHRAVLILAGMLFLLFATGIFAQTSSAPSNSKPADSATSKSSTQRSPNLAPPRSDTVNADALSEGESSSKDTPVDLSPPADDAKEHPRSSEILRDEGSGASDASEMHVWDPHKAAKDIEVGDYYFKRKNYVGAESRYREALFYKDNDALATYHLAICLEKMNRPAEAREQFENYLKILPHGPEAENARKAIERLNGPNTKATK